MCIRDRDEIEVKLILKGGGCENKNIQYSLPCELEHLGRADRNLEGVRKSILHAVWQAQGQGCAPGAVGVCIGSDRAHGYDCLLYTSCYVRAILEPALS